MCVSPDAVIGARTWCGTSSRWGILSLSLISTGPEPKPWQGGFSEAAFTPLLSSLSPTPEIDGVVIATPAARMPTGHRRIKRGQGRLFREAAGADRRRRGGYGGGGPQERPDSDGRTPADPPSRRAGHPPAAGDGRIGPPGIHRFEPPCHGYVRQEENALWSFAAHDISIILSLTGQMPIEVTAVGGSYLQPNIADVTVSNLLFERGTRAHILKLAAPLQGAAPGGHRQ